MWIKNQTGELINSRFVERIYVPVELEPESHQVMADMCDGKSFILAAVSDREAAESVVKRLFDGIRRRRKTIKLPLPLK